MYGVSECPRSVDILCAAAYSLGEKARYGGLTPLFLCIFSFYLLTDAPDAPAFFAHVSQSLTLLRLTSAKRVILMQNIAAKGSLPAAEKERKALKNGKENRFHPEKGRLPHAGRV
jgi:hypothetical protein